MDFLSAQKQPKLFPPDTSSGLNKYGECVCGPRGSAPDPTPPRTPLGKLTARRSRDPLAVFKEGRERNGKGRSERDGKGKKEKGGERERGRVVPQLLDCGCAYVSNDPKMNSVRCSKPPLGLKNAK